MRNKHLIIDGNNLAHRAYHQFKSMASKEGKNSSIVFGLPHILESLVRSQKPDRVLVVFDKGVDENRRKVLPEYKKREHREDFDYDNFIEQKRDVQRMLEYLGIPYIQPDQGEADDIIWLYARKYRRQNDQVVIVSTDKDFIQLLGKGISIQNPWKKIRITHKNVTNFYPYTAEQCVDYLILVGDKSDNIPGISGVGEKTAMKFLNTYGSIKEYLRGDAPEDKKITRSKLEPIYLRNRLLIDIRLFCRRYIKEVAKPLYKESINKKELALLCSKYSITTFTKNNFLKTFERLLQ